MLLGVSSYAWRVRHNVAHHTYTNIDGHDGDITQMPVARLVPAQPVRPWYRFQYVYIWPLYSLMGLRLQTFGDFAAFRRGSIGVSALHTPRRWDLAAFIIGKLIFITWALVIPLLFYPWWVVLVAFLGVSLALSLTMVIVFQLAHCVEEAASPSPEELRARAAGLGRAPGRVHRRFLPGQSRPDLAVGGLNFQIEHHLFPRVPHTHYPQIAPIVRAMAEKYGVRYTVQNSLGAAIGSHARHLRSMGAQGLAVELEMG